MKKTAYLCTALLFCCSLAQAQTLYTVLWNFGTVKGDGANPNAGFVFQNGYLYGTTYGGGAYCNPGCGTVFAAHLDHGSVIENAIYSFCNTGNPTTCVDGAYPIAILVLLKSPAKNQTNTPSLQKLILRSCLTKNLA